MNLHILKRKYCVMHYILLNHYHISFLTKRGSFNYSNDGLIPLGLSDLRVINTAHTPETTFAGQRAPLVENHLYDENHFGPNMRLVQRIANAVFLEWFHHPRHLNLIEISEHTIFSILFAFFCK